MPVHFPSSASSVDSAPGPAPPRALIWPRPLWHALGIALAAALAYAIFRAYQNPDLLLELGVWRLC